MQPTEENENIPKKVIEEIAPIEPIQPIQPIKPINSEKLTPSSSGGTPWMSIIGTLIFLLLAGGGAYYYFVIMKKDKESSTGEVATPEYPVKKTDGVFNPGE